MALKATASLLIRWGKDQGRPRPDSLWQAFFLLLRFSALDCFFLPFLLVSTKAIQEDVKKKTSTTSKQTNRSTEKQKTEKINRYYQQQATAKTAPSRRRMDLDLL
eukprot:m.105700 g.105700  ORF g.105700 m.105700 type:complete len:105 (-) comp51655_c0_seq1:1059-1373(-)